MTRSDVSRYVTETHTCNVTTCDKGARHVTEARSECFLGFPQHLQQMHFIALHYSLPVVSTALTLSLQQWATTYTAKHWDNPGNNLFFRWPRTIVQGVNTTLHARIYVHCPRRKVLYLQLILTAGLILFFLSILVFRMYFPAWQECWKCKLGKLNDVRDCFWKAKTYWELKCVLGI